MKTILLIRHGETIEGKREIILGQQGGKLSVRGKKEMREKADEILKSGLNLNKAVIISSDLQRAVESVCIIQKKVKLPVLYDRLLRERAAGNAEGKNIKEIDWSTYNKKPLHLRKHNGGESFSEVKARTDMIISKLRKMPEDTIIVVSHSVALAMIVAKLKKFGIKKALKEASHISKLRIRN